MKIVSPTEAIRSIPDGSAVIFPHGCVEPIGLYAAFEQEVDRFQDLTVYSGLSLGSYSFLNRGLGSNFKYITWQAAPQIRKLLAAGKAGFLPARYNDLPRIFSPAGPVPPDVVVIQVSPPENGCVSLGLSVGLNCDWVRSAPLVIAEINPNVPVSLGEGQIPIDRIDLATESDAPILEYHKSTTTEEERLIVEQLLGLIPDGAWVQLGVGSLPDQLLPRLVELNGINLFSGVISQGLVEFVSNARHTPQVITGELIGDHDLHTFCNRSQLIRMQSVRMTHNVGEIAKLPKFVSVNSAIEVDLQGQVNAEIVGGMQMSGVGGSLDYVEASAASDGGFSVLAFPSTSGNGARSRIVANLSKGSVVTIPRYCADYVVTEFGVARLKGKDLSARKEALLAIAHPEFRDGLADTSS